MLQHRIVPDEAIQAVLTELKEPQIPLVRAGLESCSIEIFSIGRLQSGIYILNFCFLLSYFGF